MSDGFQLFPYREYQTGRSSTGRRRASADPLSPTSVAEPMIPSPIVSVVPTPVPSVVYSPYDSPTTSPAPGTPAPGSPRAASPAAGSIVIVAVGSPGSSGYGSTVTRSPSVGPSSPSSPSSRAPSTNNTAASHSRTRQHRTRRSVKGIRRRRRGPRPRCDLNNFRRQASMNLAAETGRPQQYGVTRDVRLVHMQENGRVKVGKKAAVGCCVIL